MHPPTRPDQLASAGRTIPDLIAPDLRVLFVGINPGLYSGATGAHFAKPGNRFWPTIHQAGFTERQLSPLTDADELLAAGYGVTALVRRATATAAELTPDELRAGARRVIDLVERYRPRTVAVLGIGAYRTAFERPRAVIGRQEEGLGDSELWVLPNPSGLNAHYQLPALVELFGELRASLDEPHRDHS